MKADLDQVIKNYQRQIESIRDFLINVEQYLSQKIELLGTDAEFTADEAKELRELGDAFENAARAAEKGKKHPPVVLDDFSARISKFALDHVVGHQHKQILAEMVLVHLCSYLEAFLIDYLSVIFIHRQTLLGGERKVSVDIALKCNSIEELRDHIAGSHARSIVNGSIDNVAGFFSKNFKVDIATLPNWEQVRESIYRRNVVVHNQGRIDSKYLERTSSRQSTGSSLYTDKEYVTSLTESVLKFIEKFHTRVCTAFKL